MKLKKGLKRKFIRTCLVCAVSVPLLFSGSIKVIASEVICQGECEQKSQPKTIEPSTMVYHYMDQVEQIYELAKEHLGETEEYIETGIEINEEQVDEFFYSVKLYFLGETPDVSWVFEYAHPEIRKIFINQEGLQSCIEQHDIALEKLQEIVNQTQFMTTPEEKMFYYASYLYNSYTYDYTFNNSTVYSLLTEKSGVCHAYTTAFSWLCKLSGIPTMYVSGTLNEQPHAWNKVKNVDGEWIPIDVTNLHLSPNYTYVEPEYYQSHFVENEHYMFQ